jgi:hypothetical protein
VSGLEQEFPGKVKAHNVDATTQAAAKDIEQLGFKTHGIVIRSSDGKVLWKEADHQVKIDDVRNAIREQLKSKEQPREHA